MIRCNASFVKRILLVQPNSAVAEHVFGVMDNVFWKQQDVALEETVKASVILGYNGAQRRK